MIKKITCCDNCEKETKDIYNEVGWIELASRENQSIYFTVTGGRKKDRCSDAFRFFDTFKDTLLFCSPECLLNYIYKKGPNFNNKSKNVAEKLSTIKEKERKQKNLQMILHVNEMIEVE